MDVLTTDRTRLSIEIESDRKRSSNASMLSLHSSILDPLFSPAHPFTRSPLAVSHSRAALRRADRSSCSWMGVSRRRARWKSCWPRPMRCGGCGTTKTPRIEDRGSRIEDRGSRIEDRGSRIEDRGSRIEDRGSRIEVLGSWFCSLFLFSVLRRFFVLCSSYKVNMSHVNIGILAHRRRRQDKPDRAAAPRRRCHRQDWQRRCWQHPDRFFWRWNGNAALRSSPPLCPLSSMMSRST